MATLLDSSRPNITVTNTSTETAVYTVTIPGGTLGTNGIVYALLSGKKVKNGGGVDSSHEMRVYWNGTQVGAIHPTNVDQDSANGIAATAEVWISADGSTGAQVIHFRFTCGGNQFGDPTSTKEVYATASEDSTGDLDLEFRWIQPATTLHSYTSERGVVLAV